MDSRTLVIDRFPGQQEVITRLFTADPQFHTLCDKYRQCVKALDFWRRSPLCESPQRQKEHETMLAELELELQEYIGKKND